jgi:tRNA(Ile)-lysidine synthase
VSAALTQAEFAALVGAIGGFETRPFIAVGVSGGPDSLALVILADRWARAQGGEAIALHVDHRLRPESADEAETVTGWLSTRGIRSRTLVWQGAKPHTGIQEAARDARYGLLAEWCREHGCLHLLTAHQHDDQIETHLIRQRAGSGPDGLAAMSAIRELAGCRLVRPLLSVPRARLATFLATEGQPFLRDPSNLNPIYERARLRTAEPAGVAGRHDALTAARIRDLGLRRIEREAGLNALLAQSVTLHPAGFAAIDPTATQGVEPGLVEMMLARVVGCIGSGRYPPRRERVTRLLDALSRTPSRGRTLGGCRIVPWRGRWIVMRELAAAAPPKSLPPGATFLWDRRFAIAPAAGAAASGFTLDYLRDAPLPRGANLAAELPGLVRPALPVFLDEQGLAAVPHLGYRRDGVGAVPAIAFCPANPLARAGFTVV